jgi:AraC-like DNA-binding protein
VTTATALADAVLRGAALGQTVLAAIILWPRIADNALRAGFALLAAGIMAYATVSAPWALPQMTTGALILLASLNPPLLWGAGLVLLDAGPVARRWVPVLLPGFGLGAVVWLAWPPAAGGVGVLHAAAMAVLYAHVLWLAWSGREGDLVEPRRGLRRGLAAAAALTGLVVAGVETGVLRLPAALPQSLLLALALAVLSGAVVLALALRPVASPVGTAPAEPLSDAETAVLDRLRSAMSARVWAEEGITVGGLAARLATQEHRLRRVINRGLGYRNFARFINEHRVRAACAALSDAAQADRPVQQIAFELGFGSPGPFNRAFRDITGQSPTDFRATALARTRAPGSQ